MPAGSKKTVEKHMVQIFSIRDFQSLKRTIEGDGKRQSGQGIFVTGWHEMRVIHDPVIWKEEAERKAEAEAKKETEKAEAKKATEQAKAEAKAKKENAKV
jgi:hypothetical protein